MDIPNDTIHSIHANLLACYSCLSQNIQNPRINPSTYEQHFNYACYQLSIHNYVQAKKHLTYASDLIVSSLATFDQSVVDSELAIVHAQSAYLLEIQGFFKESSKIYRNILSSNHANHEMKQIIINNLASCSKNPTLADNSGNFISIQKKLLKINNAIYLSQKSNFHDASEIIKQLSQEFPNDTLVHLIQLGAQSNSDSHASTTIKIIDSLKILIKTYPLSTELMLLLAQFYLRQGKYNDIISIFTNSSPEIKFKPAIVSLLCFAYRKSGVDLVEFLQDACCYLKSIDSKDQFYHDLKKMLAINYLNSKKYQLAATELEAALCENPSDLNIVSSLVIAYSHFNPEKACVYATRLPAPVFSSKLDVCELESFLEFKTTKSTISSDKQTISKKKRKRTKILPKNYDPNSNTTLDPERWLPKHERSAFLKKLKKREGYTSGSFQGTALTGGGIGITGSANIGGKKSQLPEADKVSPALSPNSIPQTSKPSNKKKGKKGRK